jgi:hypothetical protein
MSQVVDVLLKMERARFALVEHLLQNLHHQRVRAHQSSGKRVDQRVRVLIRSQPVMKV